MRNMADSNAGNIGGKMKDAWIWIALTLMAIVVAGGCIGEKKTVDGMYKRTDFFRGNFSISGTPSLNQSFNLVFTVDPIDDLPNSTIKLFLPDAISLVSGSKEWSGNFKKGERVHLNTTLKVTMPGEWEVRAYVVENSVPSNYGEYYIYFKSTEKSGKVSRYPTPRNAPDLESILSIGLLASVAYIMRRRETK